MQFEVGGRIEPDRVAAPRRSGVRFPIFAIPGLLLVVFIAIPLLALIERALGSPEFWPSLGKPIVRDALRLTGLTTGITLLIAFVAGTPLAYLLARRRFRGQRLVETLIDLPLVLPPVVAGIALLVAFGRRGLLGDELQVIGVSLPFSTAAVIIAQVFVSVPFYVRGAKVGFAAVPVDVEEAAAIDGASSWTAFRDITLPMSLGGIGAGAVLCWARAVSEFGATLLFAGNFQGRTQTMPLAVMGAYERDIDAALALSVLMLIVSGAVLFASRSFARPVE